MKRYFKLFFIFPLTIFLFSCEAFFTNNWFQGAADYSNITPAEAISSGDPAIMQEVFDQLVIEAASATGEDAAELYLQAADLALGISGLSDPAVIPNLLSGVSGNPSDFVNLLSDPDLDLNLDALEDVGVMIANADSANPGSVTGDMWLFSAAGNGAAIANDASDAGQSVSDFLGADPLTNPDAFEAIQSLVNALEVLPDDLASQITDNQTDLETDGIVFP